MSKLADLLVPLSPITRGNPDSKPLNPPICPRCGSARSRVMSTVRNALFATPNIYARYHKCHQCRGHFWSYTDPATRDTVVQITSPTTYNTDYRRKQKAARNHLSTQENDDETDPTETTT